MLFSHSVHLHMCNVYSIRWRWVFNFPLLFFFSFGLAECSSHTLKIPYEMTNKFAAWRIECAFLTLRLVSIWLRAVVKRCREILITSFEFHPFMAFIQKYWGNRSKFSIETVVSITPFTYFPWISIESVRLLCIIWNAKIRMLCGVRLAFWMATAFKEYKSCNHKPTPVTHLIYHANSTLFLSIEIRYIPQTW